MEKDNFVKQILELVEDKTISVEKANDLINDYYNAKKSTASTDVEQYIEMKSCVIEDIAHDLMYSVDECTGKPYFDYNSMIEYMDKRNWQYFDGKVTEAKMFSIIKELVRDCTDMIAKGNEEEYTITTGGIRVNAYIDDEETINYCLEFIPTSNYSNLSLKRYKEAIND